MANELLCVWVFFFSDYPNRLEELFLISPSHSFFRVSGLSSLSDEFPQELQLTNAMKDSSLVLWHTSQDLMELFLEAVGLGFSFLLIIAWIFSKISSHRILAVKTNKGCSLFDKEPVVQKVCLFSISFFFCPLSSLNATVLQSQFRFSPSISETRK